MADLKADIISYLKKDFPEPTVEKIFTMFIESLKKLAGEINNSPETQEQDKIKKNFHSLKGILLNVGLNDLEGLASDIEKELKEGTQYPAVEEKKNELFKSLGYFIQ